MATLGLRTLSVGKNYPGTIFKGSGMYVSGTDVATANYPDQVMYGGAGSDRLAADNSCTGDTLTDCFLYRFDLSHVQVGSVLVQDATAYMTSRYLTGTPVHSIRQVKQAWGITDTTTSYQAQNPATLGQATSRRRKDYNGAGGDLGWTYSYFQVNADCCAQDSQITITANELQAYPCTPMVKRWLENGDGNHGFCIWQDTTSATAQSYYYGDLETATAPYLTVNYLVKNENLCTGGML